MRCIGVGFVGAGRISDLHAIEYLRNERAGIVALCDASPEIGRAKAEAWGVPPERLFTRPEDLLACDEVELVEVLLPHHLHAPAALAALRAGRAVSVQKPMATGLADARAMVAEAERRGLFFKLFENFVFYPPVQKAKELVDAGAIGEPLTIRIKSVFGDPRHGWSVPPAARSWRLDPATCGGGPIVFDDGHHKFALAWWFMGMPDEVHAWIGRTEIEGGIVDGPAMISFRFPGSRMGVFEAVHARDLMVDTVHYAQDDQVEITGTRGVVWITRGHGRLGDRPPVILYRDGETTGFSAMPTGWEESFVRSTRDTIEALHDRRPPLLTGGQGLDVLRFSLAALRSAESGRAVRLAEID
ncbi:MAG TPA: Gfo/Idh/MocA family oxidoreductase [Geminicoccaceae bacterium]|nr:Gfo/Idh/MocA family oxidoreductase [Geminicoccus sp.]HMU50090.1 Gfo/Idh/MocA family oxidoreductase [Geminicoccaceae bacterium]